MLEVLDARFARRWALAALAALGHAREEIDALNVYPVPDGDTGTNLYLTMESACSAVRALPRDGGMRGAAQSFARGALMGARGNSGIIAAQFLSGWAEALGRAETLDAAQVRRAVVRADLRAWEAVDRPVEGTILSVSRAAATAAAAAGNSLVEVVGSAATAAREALARTPEQLDVLRRAGVVDAGGRGLVVLLDTLEELVLCRTPIIRSGRGGLAHRRTRHPPGAHPPGCPALVAAGVGPDYEVMYLLDADPAGIPALRARLAELGGSLVVIGADRLWHVHLHADDPGAAVEAGIEVGRPYQVRITRFSDRQPPAAPRTVRSSAGTPAGMSARTAVGLVACAAGPGLAELFEQAGAVVVRGDGDHRPSTGELLAAVHAVDAEAVVVLPNDADTLAVARVAAETARRSGLRVSVLPTTAQVHGLAAAAVHDPARPVDDDMVRMSAAAGATRDGAVTVAVRDAITSAGVCRTGDVLGVIQGDVVVVGHDLVDVAVEVLTRLLSSGGELVTVVAGAGADGDLAGTVSQRLRGAGHHVEVSVLDGGQSRYPLLIGVE